MRSVIDDRFQGFIFRQSKSRPNEIYVKDGGPAWIRTRDRRIMSPSLTDLHNSSQQPAFSKLLYHVALLIVVVGLGL